MLEKMEDCARPLTTDDIAALEAEIGKTLPDSYKAFLLTHNGGLPSPDSFPILGMPNNSYGIIQEFFGIDCPIESSNLTWNYHVLIGRIPEDLFPFASTPSDDILCLSLAGEYVGEVVLWDFYNEHNPPTYSNVYRVARSFKDLVEKIFCSPESQR